MLHSAPGKVAAIWVKISTDMPLPTPRSVISSPSHMMTPVPAVIVRIMTTTGKMLLSFGPEGVPADELAIITAIVIFLGAFGLPGWIFS